MYQFYRKFLIHIQECIKDVTLQKNTHIDYRGRSNKVEISVCSRGIGGFSSNKGF